MFQRENHNRLYFVLALVVTAAVGLTIIAGQVVAGSNSPLSPQSSGWVVQDTGLYGDEIEIVSAVDGWVLRPDRGNDGQSWGLGHLYRWNGSQWSPFGNLAHSQAVRLLGDIAMISANDGWVALGPFVSDESSESTIYRWNGNTWTLHTTITEPATASWPGGIALSAIDMLSQSDGWVVGEFDRGSRFYHWDGISWRRDKTLMDVYAASDIEMVDADYGWAVGGDIAHWNGDQWMPVEAPPIGWLYDVSALSQTDAWAVGDNSSYNDGLILHWNGTSWTEVSNPAEDLIRAIDMTSANDGWAVGHDEGVAYHWNGVEWTEISLPIAANEYSGLAIDMLSESRGWIVGYKPVGDGVVLSYEVRQELTANYADGAPGSFFAFAGSDYPANEEATIDINGWIVGTIAIDANGAFTVILSTADADEGNYSVTVRGYPSANAQFVLDAAEPVRPQEGEGTVIPVPAGIALTKFVFLPTVVR